MKNNFIRRIISIVQMLKSKNKKTGSVEINESSELNTKNITEQQNSSPVCFANSDEVRDEYK